MKQPSAQSNSNNLYLKMVGSHSYRQKIKKIIESITMYNMNVRDNALTHREIVSVSRMLTDDIRTPVVHKSAVSVRKEDDKNT